jgi:hypothetical protein
MLIFSWLIGVTIAASTVAQWLAGYPYSQAQIVGMVSPFIMLALVGLWLTVIFFRNVRSRPMAQQLHRQEVHRWHTR